MATSEQAAQWVDENLGTGAPLLKKGVGTIKRTEGAFLQSPWKFVTTSGSLRRFALAVICTAVPAAPILVGKQAMLCGVTVGMLWRAV